jgi:hypothetical protein
LECGGSIHGEFDAGNIRNNTQANVTNYIGNLVIYGNNCNAINTSLLVWLVADGNYTQITSGSASYNTLINRISGAGTWGGCAAHAVANNGVGQFGNLAVANNYLDPTTEASGGSTQSSCFYNPGSIIFSGSQSGTTLTVTNTSPAGPLWPNAAILRGSNVDGVIKGQISVNPDGTGTYLMSDRRMQTYYNATEDYAPNQGNNAGTSAYAPVFSGNKNMLLASGSNAITIADARMRTSAGCHT